MNHVVEGQAKADNLTGKKGELTAPGGSAAGCCNTGAGADCVEGVTG